MNEIKVEISRYFPINKGFLKGSFTLMIMPHGLKVSDCKYFEKDGNRWFAFPQKEIKPKDASAKSTYYPYVSFTDKNYKEQLDNAVLEQLKGQANENSNPIENRQANQLQSDPSLNWF